MPHTLVIIVPFLNEAEVLPELLASLVDQVRRPDLLLLVDDGSTDGSSELARDVAEQHPWMRVVHRPRQAATRDRLATASEYAAFQWGLSQVDVAWDVVAKMDADLRLPPHMLLELEERLDEDASIGIIGTFLREARPGSGGMTRLRIPADHVHGATKFYRRACWEDISPQRAILGWDTIDERSARRAGWRTLSIELSEGDPVHLRPRGSYDGQLRAFRRFGRCDWALGQSPVLVAALGLRYMRSEPRIVGGLHYVSGYLAAGATRAPRADASVRSHTRHEEWGKVRRRLRGRRED